MIDYFASFRIFVFFAYFFFFFFLFFYHFFFFFFFLMIRRPPRSTLFPSPPLFRSARAEHRALFDHALVVEQAALARFPVQDGDGRAARDAGLEGPPRRHPAAQLVQQVLERKTHRDLVVAGLLDVAAHREQLRAGALRARECESLVPGRAVLEDVRHRRERLDVVDGRGHAEHAERGGKGRLDPRIAPLALDRVHERPLFAPDVGARAPVQVGLGLSADAGRARLGPC